MTPKPILSCLQSHTAKHCVNVLAIRGREVGARGVSRDTGATSRAYTCRLTRVLGSHSQLLDRYSGVWIILLLSNSEVHSNFNCPG